MHYKNGREAKVGDKIVGKDCGGNPIAGTIIHLQAGTDTCNAQIVPPGVPVLWGTLKDCLHVDDALKG